MKDLKFVKYEEEYLDKRGSGSSKAQIIREFIENNCDKAFYSTEIDEVLKDEGIEQRDIMSAARAKPLEEMTPARVLECLTILP